MITITAIVFDIYGAVEIDPVPGAGDGETRRRVNRVATLDGGVAAPDGGYAEGDRTLSYEWLPVSADHNESVARLVRLYSTVHVSTPDGVYLAVPQLFAPGAETCSVTLLVLDKLSE